MSIVGYLISLIFGIIETLLVLRFFFIFFSANAANSFVAWIYHVTNPIVAPFNGIFTSPPTFGFPIDVPTILALIIFGLIGYLLSRVLFPSRAPL